MSLNLGVLNDYRILEQLSDLLYTQKRLRKLVLRVWHD